MKGGQSPLRGMTSKLRLRGTQEFSPACPSESKGQRTPDADKGGMRGPGATRGSCALGNAFWLKGVKRGRKRHTACCEN